MARKRVASEPVLRDWAAVDAALRDLKECQYALTELGVELDRRIDGLKDDYTKNAQPLQNRIKRLEGDIKDYGDSPVCAYPVSKTCGAKNQGAGG